MQFIDSKMEKEAGKKCVVETFDRAEVRKQLYFPAIYLEHQSDSKTKWLRNWKVNGTFLACPRMKVVFSINVNI